MLEVDETYVDGIELGTRGHGTEREFIVALAIEALSLAGFVRVRLKRMVDASSRSLLPFDGQPLPISPPRSREKAGAPISSLKPQIAS